MFSLVCIIVFLLVLPYGIINDNYVLLHVISNDSAIFDYLCRRSLMFIHKCFLHSSNLVKFVVRYGVLAIFTFVVERRSLVGELSLSHARLAADG